jgi:hypothetical protein
MSQSLDREQIFEMASAILQHTSDGDDLAPQHLKLVEIAVNYGLSEEGVKVFAELYENVRAGYTPPWFHGIQGLTIDTEGFVYWKEQRVEHYTLS